MKPIQAGALAAILTAGFAAPASAVIMYDQNVTNNAIFGSGNTNGSYTTDRADGVELGLRGKLRFNAANAPENTFNSGGDGTYSFDSGLPPSGFGFAPGSTSTAVWNFEWSINTDYDGTSGLALDELVYTLEIDFDPGLGVNFQSFDPINVPFADHSIGDNTTAQGGGAEAADAATYSALLAGNNLAQNSWNMEFFDNAMYPFDGRVNGIYDIRLSAGYAGAAPLASTSIQILVGVPEPGTVFLMGAALMGLRVSRKQRTHAPAPDSLTAPRRCDSRT